MSQAVQLLSSVDGQGMDFATSTYIVEKTECYNQLSSSIRKSHSLRKTKFPETNTQDYETRNQLIFQFIALRSDKITLLSKSTLSFS